MSKSAEPQEIDASPAAMNFAATRPALDGDAIVQWVCWGAAACVLLILALLLVVLVHGALPSISAFGGQFLLNSTWNPDANAPSFGALPVIFGTAVTSLLALLLAVPVSLGSAIFLIRIAPKFILPVISFLIEFLAAIPSLAYGMWGLFVLTPFLRNKLEPALRESIGSVRGFEWLFNNWTFVNGRWVSQPVALSGRDMLAGALVLAIMIIPMITAISRDVLRQVPGSQIEVTVALGATWWQTTRQMLRFSREALLGTVMLGLARALGEAVAITMVIGNTNQIKASIFAPGQTLAGVLIREFGDGNTPLHRSALCEVALVLLIISLMFNVAARYLVIGKSAMRRGRRVAGNLGMLEQIR